MASRKLKHCSCYFILINYISCNKVVLDCKFVYLIIIDNTTGKPHQKIRGRQTSADIGELMHSQEGSSGRSLRRASPTQGCTANEPMEE